MNRTDIEFALDVALAFAIGVVLAYALIHWWSS